MPRNSKAISGVLQITERGQMAFDSVGEAADAEEVEENEIRKWIRDGKKHHGCYWKREQEMK